MNNKGFIKGLFLFVLGILAVFYIRTGSFDFIYDIKSKVENREAVENTFGEIVNVVKQEITNTAPLIWNIGSSKAHLTHDGVVEWTNSQRLSAANLPALTNNPKLDEIADARLEDMFNQQYFEHVSPQGEGASDVAEDVDYDFIAIGENIALGNFEDDQVLVQAWMDSPGHRANILNGTFTEIGVAVATGTYDGRKTWIGVQIFGKPAEACPSVSRDLKSRIDESTQRIDALKASADTLSQELDRMRSEDDFNRGEYNQKVIEYNTIVDQFNSLNVETKNLVSQYNAQVQAFNTCIKS